MPLRFKRDRDSLRQDMFNLNLHNTTLKALPDSGVGEISIHNDVGSSDEGEPSSEPPKDPSSSNELQQYLKALVKKSPDRKPVPTLEELQTTYAELSNDHLIPYINFCARFICLAGELSNEDDSWDTADVAEKLLAKWKERMQADTGFDAKSSEELREILVSAFNDIETFIEVNNEGDESERGLPFVSAESGTHDTGKDGD